MFTLRVPGGEAHARVLLGNDHRDNLSRNRCKIDHIARLYLFTS